MRKEKQKILIVDDDKAILKVAKDVTMRHYCNVFLDYVKPGDEELPYNIRKLHGTIVGTIALKNNKIRLITVKDVNAMRA